ncbi:MAG: AmmeMemoRadiSam system radical SAM enzyme [Spirochaetes bacterium]|nr:AmmeMemoRadiSam system radical SAM enzyme [Spirochaetota bacterium]
MIDLYKVIDDKKVQCLLCPNNCKLSENQFGLCDTRSCEKKEVVNKYSGIISSSGTDPIEKKPLYHFRPGSIIFSVGFFGCTLKCQFCQNYSISQFHPSFNHEKISPKDMVCFLKEKKYDQIAFTYSEPTLYYEWVLETSILCRKNNIKTVLVTNGYLNKEPAKQLLGFIDAANIDLKSFSNDFYKKNCRGKLEPVLEFIKIACDKAVHIEITTLIITDTNDSEEEMIKINDFISSVSKDIPFHISKYHPSYNFNKPATDLNKLRKLIEISKNKLNYVYGGNIEDYSNTYCKKCNNLLIKRDFYSISTSGLDKDGRCNKCKSENNIII